MGLETLTGGSVFIDDLVETNPLSSDGKDEGDDHLRGIKNVLKNSFPNITGAMNATHTEINNVAAGFTAHESLTYAASTAFDFDGAKVQEMATVTGNLTTLTTSNRTAGDQITVLLTASGADRTVTYNGSWVQVGALPTTIPSGKTLMLGFTVGSGAAETDVYVSGALEL